MSKQPYPVLQQCLQVLLSKKALQQCEAAVQNCLPDLLTYSKNSETKHRNCLRLHVTFKTMPTTAGNQEWAGIVPRYSL